MQRSAADALHPLSLVPSPARGEGNEYRDAVEGHGTPCPYALSRRYALAKHRPVGVRCAHRQPTTLSCPTGTLSRKRARGK